MKIRNRAFLLGLLPTLLVAALLTAFHVYSRLNDLETTVAQQGVATARHLASAAEYGVLSGNREALEKLLDQVVADPEVKTAAIVWPDRSQLVRGEPLDASRPLHQLGQYETASRSWFVYPVQLYTPDEEDPYLDAPAGTDLLAWVTVSIDLEQKHVLAQRLLLASLGITLLGLTLAILLINTLALRGLKPLMDIIETVKRISSGSFGARMDVRASSPELRELQLMVNRMSESLRSYREDMEGRVREVTAELEHKRREAEQASLAKSRFLATASHDLRQPMHAISLYVESLRPHVNGPLALDVLDKIERSINGTVELFNAILDVTKLDAGVVQPHCVPLRIRALLLRLADEFAAEADGKGISLRVKVPDVWVESDPVLLERILRNLLANALRHTQQGGVLLGGRHRRGRVRLQVWDTGCGIAPEHQPRIFEEFYQAGVQDRASRHGLGLGLAIVRRLARLLGYPLQLHSRPHRGTVITLDVPVLKDGPTVDAALPLAEQAALEGTALVVDDDPAILGALGLLLRQWGMRVLAAANLEDVGRSLDQRPDVVLADYQLLKGETGLDAIAAVHARWGNAVPAVVLTGDTRADTVRTLTTTGHGILYKPIRPQQLLALLRERCGPRAQAQD